jgi:hypothetical protein
MTRPGPLTVAVVVLSLASVALTLAAGAQPRRLLVAQVVGALGLALLGVDLARRPPLRGVGWVVLTLAAATFVVLGGAIVRALGP